jgi:hypothetical protein
MRVKNGTRDEAKGEGKGSKGELAHIGLIHGIALRAKESVRTYVLQTLQPVAATKFTYQ